jgi:hypothetical protein
LFQDLGSQRFLKSKGGGREFPNAIVGQTEKVCVQRKEVVYLIGGLMFLFLFFVFFLPCSRSHSSVPSLSTPSFILSTTTRLPSPSFSLSSNDHLATSIRAFLTSQIYLQPVIEYQSYALMSRTSPEDIQEFKSLVSEFTRHEINTIFQSPEETYFGFEFLNPFLYHSQSFFSPSPDEHSSSLPDFNSHHFHFNSNLFFTRYSINIFTNITSVTCSFLSLTQRSHLYELMASINLYQFGLERTHLIEFFRGLIDENSWCGLDALLLPSFFVKRLYLRLRSLHRHYQMYSVNSEIDPELYQVLLLNLALWEEEIIPQYLTTDTISATPHVILFPPNSNILYQKEIINDQTLCVVTPVGFDDQPEIASMIVEHHTPQLCLALGRFDQLKPPAHFIELGGYESLSRASTDSTGMTIVAQNINYFADPDESLDPLHTSIRQQYLEYLNFKSNHLLLQATGPSPEEISFPMVYTSAMTYFSRILSLRLNGCYSNDSMVHVLYDSIRSQGSRCRETIDNHLGSNQNNLQIGTAIFQLYQHQPTQMLPCLILIQPGLRNESQITDFDHFLTRLGMVSHHFLSEESSESSLSIALGPHCSSADFDKIKPLLETRIQLQLKSLLQPSPVITSLNKYSRYFFSSKNESQLVNQGRGSKMVDPIRTPAAPSPLALIEDVLPMKLLGLLRGRLSHRAHVNLGANSHFLPFNSTTLPRSLVEHIILEYLAPLVVGTQV